jgi:hypothetical protein
MSRPTRTMLLRSLLPIYCGIAGAQEMTAVPDKEILVKRVAPLGKEAADILRRPDTKVDEFKTPFFARGAVYQATNPAPHHPIVFSFGIALPHYAVMLPMNPEGFLELATHAGVDVRSDENRLLYGHVFLLATRDFSKRFQIVRDVSEIELIPHATQDEKERYQELTDRFKTQLHQPSLVEPGSREAVFFCLIGQGLFEVKLQIADDGRIRRADTLLAGDLPIAIAR